MILEKLPPVSLSTELHFSFLVGAPLSAEVTAKFQIL